MGARQAQFCNSLLQLAHLLVVDVRDALGEQFLVTLPIFFCQRHLDSGVKGSVTEGLTIFLKL